MNFRIGQKVVCVNDRSLPGYRWLRQDDHPKRGRIYTVASAEHRGAHGDYPCIHVAEVNRASGLGFRVSRFRPVTQRNTDISVLTALLNTKSREKVD